MGRTSTMKLLLALLAVAVVTAHWTHDDSLAPIDLLRGPARTSRCARTTVESRDLRLAVEDSVTRLGGLSSRACIPLASGHPKNQWHQTRQECRRQCARLGIVHERPLVVAQSRKSAHMCCGDSVVSCCPAFTSSDLDLEGLARSSVEPAIHLRGRPRVPVNPSSADGHAVGDRVASPAAFLLRDELVRQSRNIDVLL